jgi:hypothetical protein
MEPEMPPKAPAEAPVEEEISWASCLEAVSTTMIYTHVLNRPGLAVRSPLDAAGPS